MDLATNDCSLHERSGMLVSGNGVRDGALLIETDGAGGSVLGSLDARHTSGHTESIFDL